MDYKTISIQKPLYEELEKYVKERFDELGGKPQFDSVPKFSSYVLSRAISLSKDSGGEQ